MSVKQGSWLIQKPKSSRFFLGATHEGAFGARQVTVSERDQMKTEIRKHHDLRPADFLVTLYADCAMDFPSNWFLKTLTSKFNTSISSLLLVKLGPHRSLQNKNMLFLPNTAINLLKYLAASDLHVPHLVVAKMVEKENQTHNSSKKYATTLGEHDHEDQKNRKPEHHAS